VSVPAFKVKQVLSMAILAIGPFANEGVRSAFAAVSRLSIHFWGLPEAGSPD
jgi:hypothetical protein